jgi:hypothetical protein
LKQVINGKSNYNWLGNKNIDQIILKSLDDGYSVLGEVNL